MTNRIATGYRTRRWLRWSVDFVAVLVLMVVVAVAHTLMFSSPWPLLQPYQLVQGLGGQ